MTRTDTDTRDVVARLRELARKATPGPWIEGNGTVMVFDAPRHRDRVLVHTGVTADSDGARGDEDAALIVAAVNYLPRLLAVAEAAREYTDPMVEGAGGVRWWEAHDRLRHALDDLDSHEEATG